MRFRDDATPGRGHLVPTLATLVLATVATASVPAAVRTPPDARAVLAAAMERHGSRILDHALVEFELFGARFRVLHDGGLFRYEHFHDDGAHEVIDNDGVFVAVDGELRPADATRAATILSNLNGGRYLTLLPHRLDDAQVQARYLEETILAGEPYHEIEVTFSAPGADRYVLWIHRDHHTLDFRAIDLVLPGSGRRTQSFQVAVDARTVEGVLFADWVQYGPHAEVGRAIEEYDRVWSAGGLQEQARFEPRDLRVERRRAGAAGPSLPQETPPANLFSGEVTFFDLTHALSPDAVYWPGPDASPFEYEPLRTHPSGAVAMGAYATPEHHGTHLDAPVHGADRRATVDELTAADLFGPAVVVDVSARAARNPDAELTVEDLRRWEESHGPIPRGAIVLMATGWARKYDDHAAYRNLDGEGRMHFPGFSAAAARWLVQEREIRGIGTDTLSVDPGAARGFPVHGIVNPAGKYHLENVAELDRLPPAGAWLIVAPIKIAGGSGGQVRIFAAVPSR